MKARFQSIIIVLGICLFPVFVFALLAEHRGSVRGQDNWPKGLEELANRNDRVFGYFVNANDFFYYSGDTNAFNDFLANYAKLEKTVLQLVIHPGPKRAKWPGEKQDREISYDWSLSAISSFVVPEDRQNWKHPDKFVTKIDLYIGGQVGLDGLEVPDNIEVQSGGEIEQFVATHKEKQVSQQEGK